MTTPVHDPDTIPPGWGAHVGDGEWAYRCPQADCGAFFYSWKTLRIFVRKEEHK